MSIVFTHTQHTQQQASSSEEVKSFHSLSIYTSIIIITSSYMQVRQREDDVTKIMMNTQYQFEPVEQAPNVMRHTQVRGFEDDSDEEAGHMDNIEMPDEKRKNVGEIAPEPAPDIPVPVEPVMKPESLPLAAYIADEIFFSGNMPDFKNHMKYKLAVMIFDWELAQNNSQKFKAVVAGIPYMLLYFGDIIMRGVSQVYLANHPITGICICIGLWTTSYHLLVFGLCGSIVSTVAAYMVCTPKMEELEAGLCG
jgi:hypothetical protein